jgi:hypothetical protein
MPHRLYDLLDVLQEPVRAKRLRDRQQTHQAGLAKDLLTIFAGTGQATDATSTGKAGNSRTMVGKSTE